jgi:hypothetical protein
VNAIARDLFSWSPAVSMLRLDSDIDHIKPCCENLALVRTGQGPHAAELRCANCGAHRGWLKREALEFLNTTVRRFGAPAEPIILRNSTIGSHTVSDKATYDNTNRGALFRNDRKQEDNQPDYRGEIDINGVAYRLSGWKRTAKSGTPFLSLAVTPKDVQPDKPKPTASAAAPFDDTVGF